MTVDATTAPPADTAAATADDPALRAAADELLPGLQDLRRRLHAEPETGLVLPATQAAVLAELEGLGLEITTGTRTAAELLGIAGTTGTLEAGRLADLVITDVDPLADIAGLGDPDNVLVVAQAGRVVKDTIGLLDRVAAEATADRETRIPA